MSPQEQWVLREHNVEAPGPTSTTQQEAESKRIHEIIASRKSLKLPMDYELKHEGEGIEVFTFFEMFSKLGLLMREKASRNTSAPL